MATTNFTRIETTTFKDLVANDTGELLESGGTPILYAVRVDNTANSAASYFKIYDKATPAATASDDPDFVFKVAAQSKFEFQPNGNLGRKLTNGLSIRCVTTGGTGGVTSPANAVIATVLTDTP